MLALAGGEPKFDGTLEPGAAGRHRLAQRRATAGVNPALAR